MVGDVVFWFFKGLHIFMISLHVFYLGFEQNQCLYLGFMNIRSGS